MKPDEAKILSESLLEELDSLTNDINRVRNVVETFNDNCDLLNDDVTIEEIAEVFKQLDDETIDVSIEIKKIFKNSKKLKDFLHEIKLLKRKRLERLKRRNQEDDEYRLKIEQEAEASKKLYNLMCAK